MGFFDPFFDVVFAPLIGLHPGVAICIVSLLISVIIVFATKLFTDQEEMKRLRDELKKSQQEMKAHKDEPEKVMKIQKKAMSTNMEYMKKSFRVSLITIIPILLVFGWLNGHFTYEPLAPNEPFVMSVEAREGIEGNVSVLPGALEVVGGTTKQWADGVATFTLKGPPGEYLVTFGSMNSSVDKAVVISEQRKYAPVSIPAKDDVFKTINIANEPLRAWGLSWFWVYLISAIVFSTVLRKVFKVH